MNQYCEPVVEDPKIRRIPFSCLFDPMIDILIALPRAKIIPYVCREKLGFVFPVDFVQEHCGDCSYVCVPIPAVHAKSTLDADLQFFIDEYGR